MPEPMTDARLAEIHEALALVPDTAWTSVDDDVADLLAEVDRLRADLDMVRELVDPKWQWVSAPILAERIRDVVGEAP